MDIVLEKATSDDAELIFDMQVKAFKPLLEKYKDSETNPANESIDRVSSRINNPDGAFYKIVFRKNVVGAVCVVGKGNNYWIGPMFIQPNHQGKGIAQRSIALVESQFPEATSWELATILEEKRNCHLYEKMKYNKTGVTRKLNEATTLVFYKKIVTQ